MKKLFLLLFSFLLMSGCSTKTTYDEVSYDELNDMLDDKKSFILFIGSSTCSACTTYKETLNLVIEEYNVDVKYIDLSKLSSSEDASLTSEFPITGTPTTVFIEKGDEEDTHNRIVGNAKKSKIVDKFKENGYIKD